MANTTILGLPAAVQAQLTDSLPVDQADGTTRHETLAQIETLLAPMIGAASTVAGAAGAAGRGVASIVVNNSSQVVVTYSDGSTAVAGTIPAGGGAAVPAAGLVYSTGSTLANEVLDSSISNASGTLAVASSLTGSISTLGTTVASDHTSLGTAQTQLANLLAGPGSGTLTLAGNVLTQHNAAGTAVGTLTLPSTSGTINAPASAPLLFTDASGQLHAGAVVAAHVVSTGGTLDLGSAALHGIVGTVSTSGSTTTLNMLDGTPVVLTALAGTPGAAGGQGAQGIQGPTGSVAAGALTGNVVASTAGGPDQPLSTILRRVLDSDDFGSQHNGNTIQQVLGLTTRAAVAAYKNSSGNTPYSFFANYPTSSGDDIEVYAPVPTTSGNVLMLAKSVTLPAAASGYTGPTGLYQGAATKNWFLYVGGTPGRDWQPGQYAVFPGLSANTKVLATYNNCIQVTAQPAGTTCAAGTVGYIGANMAALVKGQQVWAAQGIQPFTHISSISGLTVLLDKAVDTTSKDSYGNQISGVFQLQPIHIFTPLSESSLCGFMTMDSLALPASVYAQQSYDGSSEGTHWSRGQHVINVPIRVVGMAGSVHGAECYQTDLRSQCNAFALVSMFPPQAVKVTYGDLFFRPYSGFQQAGLYVEGNSEHQPVQNNASNTAGSVSFYRMDGTASWGGGTTTPFGAAQLIRARHCGGVQAHDISLDRGYGNDPSPYNSCVISVANCVFCEFNRCGGDFVQAVVLGEGYGEDWAFQSMSSSPSGYIFDNWLASVLVGTQSGLLIVKVHGGDMDTFYEGYRICFASGVTIGDTEIQEPETPSAPAPGLATTASLGLYACTSGTVEGINGGSGTTAADAIQLNPYDLDGGQLGTTGIAFGLINVGGYAAAIRVAPGCNGNEFDDATILLNGSSTGAIVDGGSNSHLSSAPERNKATCYSNPATLTTTPSQIPLAGYLDKTGMFAAGNGAATIKVAGTYIVTGTMAAADAGSAGAPAAGVQIGLQVNGSVMGAGPVEWATAGSAHTTARYDETFTLAAGEVVTLNGQTSSGSAAMQNAHFTLLCIDLT